MSKRPLNGLVVGLGCAFLMLVLMLRVDRAPLRLRIDPGLFGLESLVYDAMARSVASRIDPDPRVAIVAVNEKSVATLKQMGFGRPQSYPRNLYAMAIDEVRRGGGRVVAFDVLFTEPDEKNRLEGDLPFAEALGTMPAVLAAQTFDAEGGALFAPIPPEYRDKLWSVAGAAPAEPLRLVAPDATFHTAAAIGSIRFISGSRRYVVAGRVGSKEYIPSLAVATAAAFLGLPKHAMWDARDGRAVIGKLRIPVDGNGLFAIRWAGSTFDARKGREANPYVYDVIDFDRVIAAAMMRQDSASAGRLPEIERFEREKFGGKIVIVGVTAAGGYDLRSTPLTPAIGGVVIHANAIDNLINGRFNRDASRPLVLAILFVVAALCGFGLYQIRSQIAAALVAIAVMAAWLGSAYLALDRGIIVFSAAPLIAIALSFTGSTVLRFLAEQDQSRQIKRTFGKYVSPQILEYILDHPERVELGGDRVDLTILFSDIRGFTSISEAAEPEAVVEMLNEYLTRMVEILLRYGGTLDKFIGDAVMGFWNAPAPDPDHALHAVQCAIEMIDETARLRAEWVKEGKPALRIGVGINTGDAVVGNIGSRQVFGYTVIGDAVNLASRLESKNKDYGTEIIISESTRERIGDAIATTYLDEVKVKGKEIAVRIFQVKGTVE
jgi:adenylate cyclase